MKALAAVLMLAACGESQKGDLAREASRPIDWIACELSCQDQDLVCSHLGNDGCGPLPCMRTKSCDAIGHSCVCRP